MEKERFTPENFPLRERLKEALQEKEEQTEKPSDPKSHLEILEKIETRKEEERKQIEEGEKPEKKPETKFPPRLRWRTLHSQYITEMDERKRRAFEDLETIAWLENDIFDAKEFLNEVKKEGTYNPKSPAVMEAEKILQENPKKIEKIKKANPDVEELWLKPRMEEYEKYKAEERKAKEARAFIEKIKTVLEEEEVDYGDLITGIRQAEKGEYLESHSIDEESVKKLIKEQPWKCIRIKNMVYTASTQEHSREVFFVLKKLERKVFEKERDRRKHEIELMKKQNISIEKALDPQIPEGARFYLPIRSPVKIGNEIIFLRGGILFESAKSQKGNVYWKISEINGNIRNSGITEKNVFCAGFVNAPEWLRNLISEASKKEKNQHTQEETPTSEKKTQTPEGEKK